jgi:hypothetical protein
MFADSLVVDIRPPDLDWFDVATLAALPRPPFARPLNRAFVRRLAQHWILDGVIDVSLHAKGESIVIDGRHRVAAAALAEQLKLPAAVYEGLSLKQEAALFLLRNLRRCP